MGLGRGEADTWVDDMSSSHRTGGTPEFLSIYIVCKGTHPKSVWV